jgi:hypothetical protein
VYDYLVIDTVKSIVTEGGGDLAVPGARRVPVACGPDQGCCALTPCDMVATHAR